MRAQDLIIGSGIYHCKPVSLKKRAEGVVKLLGSHEIQRRQPGDSIVMDKYARRRRARMNWALKKEVGTHITNAVDE